LFNPFHGPKDDLFLVTYSKILKAAPIVGTIAVIAAGVACNAFGVICAAAVSALNAGVTTGKVGKAFEAFGISLGEGAAFYGAGSIVQSVAGSLGPIGSTALSVGLHGVVGGVFSELQGGKFEQGFLAAGFAEAVGTPRGIGLVASTIISAVEGGIGAILGGGK